jgi:four helix bundle protein
MAINYADSELWQHANRFTRYVLRLFARKFWSGGTQIRRAAISVSTNITQRLGREPVSDGRELTIARGELWEAHYLISLALDLQIINADEAQIGFRLADIANQAIESEQYPLDEVDTESLDLDNIPF